MQPQITATSLLQSSHSVYPLTLAQQRMWFLHQLNTDSLSFNISLVFSLKGPLNTAALNTSLRQLLERHLILRANIIEQGGEPVQIIRPAIGDPLEMIDLCSFPPTKRLHREDELLQKALAQPFNLATDHLVRTMLIRLEEEQHTLVLIMHHIITDMWSMDVFCYELSTLYNDLASGREPSLPPLALQYTDYALTQRSKQYQQAYKEHEAYWRQQLAEKLPHMALPYDRHRKVGHVLNGEIERITIARRTFQGLRQICRDHGATLFAGLLAAFNLFLHRLTGQHRLVVGTFLANRNHLNLEGTIGLLFSNLPVVTEIDGNVSFLELLDLTWHKMMELLDHADYAVDELLESLHGHDNTSQFPTYNVTFQLYHRNDHRLSLHQIEARQRRVFQGTKFDLMFYGSASQDNLDIWFNYNSDLFDAVTIRRWLHHFKTLLHSIVSRPESPLAALDLLTPAEQYELSHTFNATLTPYPYDETIQTLLEAQVALYPNRTAVVADTETVRPSHWTYAELNQQINKLAHELRRKGVGRGTVVGVLLPRRLDIAVADLGVIKAGGVCLLLDISYPPIRLQHMITDSGASLVITLSTVIDGLNLTDIPPCLILDKVKWEGPPDNLSVDNTPEDIAFIVYTSGSTGVPKGVMLSHRAVISQVHHRLHSLEIAPDAPLCLSLSVAFSTLPMQLLVPLFAGLPLIIYSEETVMDVRRLFQRVDRDGVQLVEVTVSTLNAYLRYVDLNNDHKCPLLSLRTVVTAGEKLLPEIAQHFYEHYPMVQLVTTFGQSEATGIMANELVPNLPELDRVTEGYPSANNRVYVLDSYLKLAPIGVPGTVYFAGDGMASGYVNNHTATKERFVPDPFVPGQYMVNTGDIARRMADGRLEVLGRSDMMVKIRGNRVELAEVEKCLLSFPGVEDCVVTVCEGEAIGKELVGYYTAQKALSVVALRQHLQRYLPQFMVPGYFVRISAIPLNPNNKVDRFALPDPKILVADSINSTRDTVSSPTELALAQLWEKVLGRSGFSRYDNFFESGGHSLKAMELVGQIHATRDQVVPLVLIFSHPTLCDMAAALEKYQTQQDLLSE